MRDLQYAIEDYIAEVKQEENLQIVLNSGSMEYLWKLTKFVAEPICSKTEYMPDPSIKDYAKVDFELLDVIQTKMIEILENNLNEDNLNYFCYFIDNIPGANKDKYHYFSDIFTSDFPLWIKKNIVPLDKLKK